MSNLNCFLKPLYRERKIEFAVSDRFVDENGNPAKVIMKSLTQDELNAIARRSTHDKVINGKTIQDIDATEHLNRCIIASMVFPDLTSKELCNAYGTEDPVLLPSKMFLVDEYDRISRAFAELNKLNRDENGNIEISGEITKN